MGIKTKLITIFMAIKDLPLAALAVVAFMGLSSLGEGLSSDIAELGDQSGKALGEMAAMSVDRSVKALDERSTEAIERLTTETARQVATFLKGRDNDILAAASLRPSKEVYRKFLREKTGDVVVIPEWVLAQDGRSWVPAGKPRTPDGKKSARNPDNGRDFHYRAPDRGAGVESVPLYAEMTFVGLDGVETVKVSSSDLFDETGRDVSDRENTYCGAETYFPELPRTPGAVYVSEVVGPHVKSSVIGTYTPESADKAGVPFNPEEAGFAGKENPVGRKFQGIIRWATPVFTDGKLSGWVTLALNHVHVMEFTDHIVPTPERWSDMPDAGSGNYAFMWDYKGRNISHPRDYFIAGYDADTGEPSIPWMEESRYRDLLESGKPFGQWAATAKTMVEQSLGKRPDRGLTGSGHVGLDCRFLDFAPQCDGWMQLTEDGGSGSFVIFWSGLWKLTTAAAIPYHTGRYAGPRGFGFVTIGANVGEFHKAATKTGHELSAMAADFGMSLKRASAAMSARADNQLAETGREIVLSTAAMIVVVILIAAFMAQALTKRITEVISGFERFKEGGRAADIPVRSTDELGQLASAFNDMTDEISGLLESLKREKDNYRDFFDRAPEGIYRSTGTGKLFAVNQAMADMFGYDSPEAMLRAAKNDAMRLSSDPGERDKVLDILSRDGEINDYVFSGIRTDGETVMVGLSAHWVTLDDGSRHIEGMCVDVTERQKAMEAMKVAKEKAEELSSMKSGFLSMVSHELRTPLTSVVGFAKMSRKLLRKAMDKGCGSTDGCVGRPGRVMDNIDIIVAEGERLGDLINDVLDLSKLEAGAMEIKREAVDMADVVDRSVKATEVLFENAGITLATSVGDGCGVWGDFDRLVQVCINLLSNAAKFAPEGHVGVRVDKDDDMVILSVADDGVGVPEEYREAVFDKFRQLGDTMTDKPRGTGLGLPICREIAELHGGTIVMSGTPGGGTTVTVRLPAA